MKYGTNFNAIVSMTHFKHNNQPLEIHIGATSTMCVQQYIVWFDLIDNFVSHNTNTFHVNQNGYS